MPPDIMAGATALAGAIPAGHIVTAGTNSPPGSDPLAALFAALLAQSSGPTAAIGLAIPKPKSTTSPITDETADSGKEKLPTDKTRDSILTDKTLNAALPVLPPPVLPIQMRVTETKPILPPTAGVTAGPKTMDTALVAASLPQEATTQKPIRELALPKVAATAPPASPLFPALLIPAASIPTISTPAAVPAGTQANLSVGTVQTAGTSALPLAAGSQPRAAVAAGNQPRAAVAAAPLLPTMPLRTQAVSTTETLPDSTFPAVVPPPTALLMTKLPKTFAVSPAISSENADVPVTATAAVPVAPIRSLPSVYVPASQGFPVRGEAVAASAAAPPVKEAVTPVPSAPVPANTPALTTLLDILAPSLGVAPNSTEGKIATDGTHAMESVFATDGIQTTESIPATDGISSDPSTVTVLPAVPSFALGKQAAVGPLVKVPEKGLQSAALPADTNTRMQTASAAATAPTELTLQVIGKRSERREAGDDISSAVLTPQMTPSTVETVRTEAKPLTAAEQKEMVRQVADGVGAMRPSTQPGKADQMTLQLHPKDWGQLQISVTLAPVTQPGAAQTVTAHIVAENPQVKVALENHSSDLRQSLREAGLNLDKMTVTVQSAAASSPAGTASSGHHGMNDPGFGQSQPDPGTGRSGDVNTGMTSFTTFSGHSQGGRQGGQPSAYTAAYSRMEPDREDLPEAQASRRLPLGQVDMRA